ncbi:MAG: hypothetical protein KJ062_12730 [Thermoanaerobaculia bacterium]|nr:hypothetical protein [Thermoanaerobaculia bacterium]
MKKLQFLSAALLLGFASSAPAADLTTFQKAWFASTKPGSWVKYEQTTTDPKGKVRKSEMTMSRLGGDGDATWFEIRMVPKEGAKGKPTTIKYLLKTNFKVEENALDYMKYVETMILQEDGQEALEYPVEMMSQVAPALASNVDYGANVTPLGACSYEGKGGEKYRIEGSFDVKVVIVRMKGTTDTEVCLSDSVPFGRLYEKTVTKDDKGKLRDTTEMRVLDSGTGATSAIKGPVKKIEMPKMPWGG